MTPPVHVQFALSTAEEERQQVFVQNTQEPPQSALPPGVYRVIDGSLFSVQPGVPPTLPLTTERSKA
jgi:hypothetical protein